MVEELLKKIEDCENNIKYERHKDKYLDKLVHSYPTLTVPEEKELFKLYRSTKDHKYKDIIFKCHLKDVHDTCTDTSSYREDLISEGIVLLCEFIDYFDNNMPYITFREALVTRLFVLYTSKKMENDLNNNMFLQELKEYEKNNDVSIDEIKSNKNKQRSRKIIEVKEELIIIPNFKKKKNYDVLLDYKPKTLINKPKRISDTSYIDY